MKVKSESSNNPYRSALEFALGVPFSDGNSVTSLHNGDAIFPSMLDAIQHAEATIDFVTFVYWEGDVATQLAQMLAERARQGVIVRVLLDSFGAKKIHKELVDDMLDAGVDLRWFRPLSTWRIWRSDKRTHRKILVCDNRVGFTGGVGIADEWSGNARDNSEWRDSHFKIQGPALMGLRAAFLDNWNEAGDWLFEPAPQQSYAHSGSVAIQMVRASTTIGWTDISVLIRTLISVAQRRVIVVTAYFAPDTTLVDMLCKTAESGIDVTILTAGKYTDSKWSQLAGQRHYDTLSSSGVKIFLYQKTLLHTKLILVDDEVSCLGSANLNHRSLSKDEECCLVALSSQLNEELAQRFEDDCQNAMLIELEAWRRRGALIRSTEKLAGLFVEQL